MDLFRLNTKIIKWRQDSNFQRILSLLVFYFLLTCISIVDNSLYAQNIIINGDFEKSSGKPFFRGMNILHPFDLDGWFVENSVDLYSGKRNNGDGCLKTPLQPFSGENYIGFSIFDISLINYRESIIGSLSQPVLTNNKYIFDMKITYGSKLSFLVNDLYIYFLKAENEIKSSNDFIITDTFKLSNIKDINPEKWLQYTDTLLSTSEANYIGIGTVVKDDKSLSLIHRKNNSSCARCYFYLDDVKLIPLNRTETRIPLNNGNDVDSIKIKPNGIKEYLSILFDFNSSELKKESMDTLRVFFESIKKYNKINVIGHTDTIGSRDYNLSLSLNRAEAVKNYIIQLGVEKNIIEIFYKGDERPLYSNTSEINRSKNRRVEIIIE